MAESFDTIAAESRDVLSGPLILNVALHADEVLLLMAIVLGYMASVVVTEDPDNLALALEFVDVVLQLWGNLHLVSAL